MKNYILLFLTLFLASCSVSTETTLEEKKLEHYQSEEMKTLGLPFSDAVIVNDIIYLSGQIGNLPGSLELAPGGLQAEAKQAIENMKAVLEANGSSLDNVIKVTVMMADIDEWGEFNKEYIKYFTAENKPARSAFGTSGLALGARLEIECIALKRK
ncbi:RidA family protein [Roseivirga sp.]|uniref:RidA family protein n=1 Tax=Roseivirga sp. TaxID=1964215 RepID=UPI002B268A77|nr:RidA family protein [Roseivirga sp.]